MIHKYIDKNSHFFCTTFRFYELGNSHKTEGCETCVSSSKSDFRFIWMQINVIQRIKSDSSLSTVIKASSKSALEIDVLS